MNPTAIKVLAVLGIGGVVGIGVAIYRDRNSEAEEPIAEEVIAPDRPTRVATGGGFSGAGYNPNITPPQQTAIPPPPNTAPLVTPPGNQTTALAGRGDGVNGGLVEEWAETSWMPPPPPVSAPRETDGVNGF